MRRILDCVITGKSSSKLPSRLPLVILACDTPGYIGYLPPIAGGLCRAAKQLPWTANRRSYCKLPASDVLMPLTTGGEVTGCCSTTVQFESGAIVFKKCV